MIKGALNIHIQSLELTLLPSGGIWVKSMNILILSDLHLGKIGHFRKSGIPLPSSAEDANYDNFIGLLQNTTPGKVLFLGDLFHSNYNHEWENFGQILHSFPAIEFILIRGNHDILSQHQYKKFNISCCDSYLLGSILMTHEPVKTKQYNLYGHLHPGVQLKGKGRQKLTFPAFVFGSNYAIIPAFGAFTGLHKVKTKPKDALYLIVENEVIKVD